MSKVGTYNAFDGKLDLNIYIVINPDVLSEIVSC